MTDEPAARSFIDVVFNVNKSQCQAQILTLNPQVV